LTDLKKPVYVLPLEKSASPRFHALAAPGFPETQTFSFILIGVFGRGYLYLFIESAVVTLKTETPSINHSILPSVYSRE